MIGPDIELHPAEARRLRQERTRRTIAKIQQQNAVLAKAQQERDAVAGAATRERRRLNTPEARAAERAAYLEKVRLESQWLAEDEADAAEFAAAIAARKQQRLRERGLT